MLIVPGRAALSAARQLRALGKGQAACPGLRGLTARWIHLVTTERPLTAAEAAQLDELLTCGPRDDGPPVTPAGSVEMLTFYVTPRIGTTSPWSSKATDIAHVCGLASITRIERGIAYLALGTGLSVQALGAALADRMTESVIEHEADLARVLAHGAPRPLGFVRLGADPIATLGEASQRLGLALAPDEIAYLVERYRELGRDPTDVELMMFAQANSEHCRHKIFNAEVWLGGERQPHSLFQLIKRSTEQAPEGVLSAYKDNAAVVEGVVAERLFPDADRVYRGHREPSHILGKVETHNHPTAISPFPGAATGSGGEIRDEGATGRGGKPKAGLVGFTVSDLRLPGALEPWEPPDERWIGSPARIATALEIMTDGPLGGAAFNNEFGRPAILGYFRTFEHAEPDGAVARGYHKPVMLAGGIGAVRPGHVAKAPVAAGAALIVLGGPAFLIGLGGGAASSLAQGASAEDLDFASVQRDNPEIQRRCQEVIDRCWAIGANRCQSLVQDRQIAGVAGAQRQRQVEIETLADSVAQLLGMAPEIWVEHPRIGMERDRQHIGPVVEDALSPVAVMQIDVEHRHPLVAAPCPGRGDRGVVEVAESASHVGEGMMARRPAERVGNRRASQDQLRRLHRAIGACHRRRPCHGPDRASGVRHMEACLAHDRIRIGGMAAIGMDVGNDLRRGLGQGQPALMGGFEKVQIGTAMHGLSRFGPEVGRRHDRVTGLGCGLPQDIGALGFFGAPMPLPADEEALRVVAQLRFGEDDLHRDSLP